MQIQTSDLLPTLYDRIVENFTRIKLTQAQQSAILITLITSLRQSAMAYSKDYIDVSSREKLFDLNLLTADRFTSRWLSRDELPEPISKGASLDRHLTSIGLLLIEARVDISLEAAQTLFVEGFNIYDHNGIGSHH